MSWESVRNLKRMSPLLLIIRNLCVQGKAPQEVLEKIKEIDEILREVFSEFHNSPEVCTRIGALPNIVAGFECGVASRSRRVLRIRCDCLDGPGVRAKPFKAMTEDKPAFIHKRLAQSECCCRLKSCQSRSRGAMIEYSKRIKQLIGEWMTEAYERELHRELGKLEESMAAWRRGDISNGEMSHRIHEWETGPSRALFKQYNKDPKDMLVAYAIVLGILGIFCGNRGKNNIISRK